MNFYKSYIDNMAQTPEESYRGIVQQTINSQFYNTTQLRTIKEQSYPFSTNYTEYEVWVGSVSEISVNTNKNITDFIRVMYKDITHPLNHRGQKYLYKPDDVNENIYLCYDKMNSLTQVPDFKAVRCNNHLTWVGADGSIIKEPCYIGEEISSTNNQISKEATIPQRRLVCMMQGNDKTASIKLNQRFILSNKQAFKITEMNVYSQDDYVSEDVTLYTFYIEWSSLLASDNVALNLADYYTSNYTLQIDQSDLSLLPSTSGVLSATTTLNGSITTTPIQWTSSNSNVVKVTSNGSYDVIGLSGTSCTITCTIQGNEQVSDSIIINVANVPSSNKVLIITPNSLDSIKKNTTKSIYFGVYINETLQSDIVTYLPSGALSSCYTIVNTSGGIDIKCLTSSTTPLTLTFTSGALTKTMTINLVGLL